MKIVTRICFARPAAFIHAFSNSLKMAQAAADWDDMRRAAHLEWYESSAPFSGQGLNQCFTFSLELNGRESTMITRYTQPW